MLKAIARHAPAVAALGALISASVGMAAETETRTDIPSITVRYTDLDLNTSAGVRELYSRLRIAARNVCNVGESRALINAMESKSCYVQVLGRAVDDAHLPTLTSLHRVESAHERRS